MDEKREMTWEEAVEKAIKKYKRDLDMLREYDLKVKASRPTSTP